jgi:TonB family protein
MFERSPFTNGRSTSSLAVSLAIHVAAAIVLFAVHFTVQSAIVRRREANVQLVAPAATRVKRRASVRAPRVLRVVRPKLPAPRMPALAPTVALTQPPAIQAPIPVQTPIAIAEAAPKPPAPKPASAETGGFGNAAPVVAKAIPNTVSPVRTGGFETVSMASGSAVRTVQTAAVGFGAALPAAAFASTRGPVRSGGFGDAVTAAPTVGGLRNENPPPATAAQILDKPRPAYTEEARRLQIEGEVQLEVLFGASGEIHILRVVRGLGHGLDENAAHAAKAIRFLPARRDGRAVDSTAMVHIIFQLAS